MSKKSKGLGDTIKKFTSATKIDKLAKKIAKAVGKDDCGCDERQEKLNKMFPYKTEEREYDENSPMYLKQEILCVWEKIKDGQAPDVKTKKRFVELYNTIYKTKYKPTTNCGSCLHTMWKGIKSLYEKLNK
tara:strand:- start:2906 stop:3298 length:393 start_codon:yes stop_codon:yes gene_type:complete